MLSFGHFHQRHHRRAVEFVDVEQLAQAGHFGVDHVVGQNHGERLFAHQFAGAQDGVPQAQRFLLPHVGDVDHVGNRAHRRQQILLVARFEQVFQLEADVEVILDGGLAAAGDDDDVLDAGLHRLLDAVLDQRLIHQRQHFFGLRFGGGKESCAEPRRGKDRLANFCNHRFSFYRTEVKENRENS